jgi:hypothetical protein
METVERYEYKFVLNATQRAALLSELSHELLPDTHGGSAGWYPIVSLYYDTPDLKCFWETWRGLPSRRKMRVRVYGSKDGVIPPTSFIEIKQKVDSRGVKRRVQTTLANALALARGETVEANFNHAEAVALAEVKNLIELEGFRPSILMRYRRHAYFLHTPEVEASKRLRVTFDDSLAARFDHFVPETDDQNFSDYLLPKGHSIMELKGSEPVPFNFAQTLTKLKLAPQRFSKYCTGIRLGQTKLQLHA